MPKNRNSLKAQRTKAFNAQGGLCFYCEQPMWNEHPTELSRRRDVLRRAVRLFQCTGEHLNPHSKGGTSNQKNIVAACLYCNSKRHRRRKALTPKQFKALVKKRVNSGRWNTHLLNV